MIQLTNNSSTICLYSECSSLASLHSIIKQARLALQWIVLLKFWLPNHLKKRALSLSDSSLIVILLNSLSVSLPPFKDSTSLQSSFTTSSEPGDWQHFMLVIFLIMLSSSESKTLSGFKLHQSDIAASIQGFPVFCPSCHFSRNAMIALVGRSQLGKYLSFSSNFFHGISNLSGCGVEIILMVMGFQTLSRKEMRMCTTSK